MRKAAQVTPTGWLTQAETLPDELLLLDESEAVDRFFDSWNHRRLRGWLWAFAAVMAVYGLVNAVGGTPWLAVVAGIALVGDLVLLRAHRAGALAARIRPVCAGVLVGHLVAFQVLHPTVEADVAVFWFVVTVVLSARLLLEIGEHGALLAALYSLLALRIALVKTVILREAVPVAELVSLAVVALLALAVAATLTYRARRRFLVRWGAESSRHRDRLRMKEELEYARSIQLSMLPRSAPEVGWLDIAALSLPATEVGGDYYDYFALDAQRLAIVIGDVTGHGVASGLVLSGVRASLNLLQEELDHPAGVLTRVNRMLRKISTPRMLMTLGVAVFDRGDRSLTFASAAHPPLLVLVGAEGRVDEVGRGSLPLGAMEDTPYRQDRIPLAPGDVVLLYSDGIVEAIRDDGEQYGWGRLRQALRGAEAVGSARDIRDALLRDLWDWKGETEQVDDVTMVVVRVVG